MPLFSPIGSRVGLFLREKSPVLAILGALGLALALAAPAGPLRQAAFLPGTQPGSADTIPSGGVLLCKQCHSSTAASRPVTISTDWSGGMMAHAARDPLFFAALAVANKYSSAVGNNAGEFCIRCHSPSGWLAGRSEDVSGASLRGTDFDGIQCDYCHRSIDPLNPDTSAAPLTFPVPGYGNAMHVMQRAQEPKRGALDSASAPHPTRADPFQRKSELCAVCHEVSNPFLTEGQDRIVLSPHEYAPIERTYSEWLMSAYPAKGDSGTCQSCHMERSPAYICVYSTSPLRPDIGKHDLTGGNTFVPLILPDFWSGLDTAALNAGIGRARATLERAAELSLAAIRRGDTVAAEVRVTNLTGHKLPTGYPDGRRIWIEVVGMSSGGDTLFRSGAYDGDSARLIEDPHIKVYEAVFGLTPGAAAQYGLEPGPSFHFGLNDTLIKDNRIPPKGFTNAGFASRLASPVGTAYADSQYWDVSSYRLPGEVSTVTASLYYQTISREYIEFLREENEGNFFDWNDWGGRLAASWERRGKSAPVVMERTTVAVRDTTAGVAGGSSDGLPLHFALRQNFPNPFNPSTRITFTIAPGADAQLGSLRIYDLAGREVRVLLEERLRSGTYERTWNAGDMPSGVYIARLVFGRESLSMKMVLLR